jgi:hypothetical protein
MRWIIETLNGFRTSQSVLPHSSLQRAAVNKLKGKHIMTKNSKRSVVLSIAVLILFVLVAPARVSELDELKATIQSMQKSMERITSKLPKMGQVIEI